MARDTLTGTRIRERRTALGMKQAELALVCRLAALAPPSHAFVQFETPLLEPAFTKSDDFFCEVVDFDLLHASFCEAVDTCLQPVVAGRS